ncbi:ABC-type Zn uptake system ZnuABC Zn-binding protein ZnuA [Paenibacillus sp. PastF-1]|nr:ABC-type Zn uptake system ZnuABC Zn-binding protein ZnuA [Paenibacillus sp. PastF-2]MDF9848897.1 ABC-type Zn uptake system ZnuABC Zn-binding protein ZnuA [Paenibacillus sp. PastM-2]MDF9855467.1 ABC-type Zn uptake system ZnuABC Zn-binding protein ZnuA [Paenibacillus sp. PastF-1]MDH6480657.1 ABC-type Zn uptake system ZnuABC Zn-binding protein ZnuA [Paenibacillus sp. PastH-2]MDH6508161.1 ABC-type Zn uptake system ZnuABC Zn-binding protein ZnuA [Paenibacillus sp. PastM-3]
MFSGLTASYYINTPPGGTIALILLLFLLAAIAAQRLITQVPIAGLSPEQEPSAAQMAEIVEFANANDV